MWVTKILISKLSYQKPCNHFACLAPSLTLLSLIIWSRIFLTRFTLCTALLLECAPKLYSWTEQVNKVFKLLLAFIHTLQKIAFGWCNCYAIDGIVTGADNQCQHRVGTLVHVHWYMYIGTGVRLESFFLEPDFVCEIHWKIMIGRRQNLNLLSLKDDRIKIEAAAQFLKIITL